MEVYIDDVVVKSKCFEMHLVELQQAMKRTRLHNLKMNPTKCAFGVSAANFLGVLVHKQGIEVDKNKAKSILEASPHRTKKELQSLFGKMNFLRRFIVNSTGKMKYLSPLLRLKNLEEMVW